MSKELSISKITVNPYIGQDAYIPAAYPTQDYLVRTCKTHTECCEGGSFVVPEPEPDLLPDCITVVDVTNGEGNDLELTGNEYEGSGVVAEVDVAGFWSVDLGGTTYTKTDNADSPIGSYCSSDGGVIAVIPCDKYSGPPPAEVGCVALAYTNLEGIAEQDFNADALGSAYIGEFGGGVLTYVGDRWEWSINGDTLVGGSDEHDPTGLYMAGDTCALFKPCSDEEPPALPLCLESVFRDNNSFPLNQWNYDGTDYVPVNTDQGTLSYSNADGWTISGGVEDYVKKDEPLDGDNPVGIYISVVGNSNELLVRECE